VIIAY